MDETMELKKIQELNKKYGKLTLGEIFERLDNLENEYLQCPCCSCTTTYSEFIKGKDIIVVEDNIDNITIPDENRAIEVLKEMIELRRLYIQEKWNNQICLNEIDSILKKWEGIKP